MATSTPDPGTHDAFLQRRVGTLLIGLGTMSLLFLVYSVAECIIEDDVLWTEGRIFHVATTAVLFVAVLFLRSKERSVRVVYFVDAAALIGASALLAATVRDNHIGYRPEFTLMSALSLFIVCRSAFVPSTGRRTAVLSAALGVLVLGLTWDTYVDYVPPIPAVAGVEPYPSMSPAGVTAYMSIWWLAASATAIAVSHVIYGLRREVDRARRLGQYALEELIGEGGMGRVYRARHAMLRRPTAIKLLVGGREEQLARFEREVQLTASLTHPNTIAVFDYGRTPDGIFYYAMEYLDGLNLEELVAQDGPQPASRVIAVMRQVCGALQEAHTAGLIHRDVKPANIILCKRGGAFDVAKVLDFGLVKAVDADPAQLEKTATNIIVGTPLYIAPEAIRDADSVEARSDLYALGAVAYFMLTGQPLFKGPSVVEVCAQHLHDTPAPPSSRGVDVPEDLEALILRCLAKDPSERPADAATLSADLSRCGDASGWTATEAQSWWTAHAAAPTAQTPKSEALETIEVALNRR